MNAFTITEKNDKGRLQYDKGYDGGKIMPMLVGLPLFPLVLGNLFQRRHNAVDGIIVGHFVGKEAAGGWRLRITEIPFHSSDPFLNGLCIGAAVAARSAKVQSPEGLYSR